MFQSVSSFISTLAVLGIVGYVVRSTLRRLGVPPAVSLIALGVLVGPAAADWMPPAWLEQRTLISTGAFVVLLVRAAVALPYSGMRAVVGAGVVFGSIPVLFELLAVAGLGRAAGIFDRGALAVLAGFVVAAVSPAVILPIMLEQKDRGRGVARNVPDRIIGHTVVNAFIAQTGILILLGALAPNASDGTLTRSLAWLPVQLVGGIAVGVLAGTVLRVERWIPEARTNEAPENTWRLWAVALAILAAGAAVYFSCQRFSMESVFATLAVGFILRTRVRRFEQALRQRLRTVWSLAEIALFANLGSQIQVDRLEASWEIVWLVAIVAAALAVRLVVAAFLTRLTSLTRFERGYVVASHVPKATIQAVFGALPWATFSARGQLDLLADGHTILILAVIAIIGTAPVGAVLLERGGRRLDAGG